MTPRLRRATVPLLMTVLILVVAGAAVWFALAMGDSDAASALPPVRLGEATVETDDSTAAEQTVTTGHGYGQGATYQGTSSTGAGGDTSGTTSAQNDPAETGASSSLDDGDDADPAGTTIVTSHVRIQAGKAGSDQTQSTGEGSVHDGSGSNHDGGR